MIKRLTRHGNSHDLVIETPRSVATNAKKRKAFSRALEKVNKRFGPALRRLAG